jgi:hypothetical protein
MIAIGIKSKIIANILAIFAKQPSASGPLSVICSLEMQEIDFEYSAATSL